MKTLTVKFFGWEMVFSDWFDLADYIKQRQLAGLVTTIIGWHYNEECSEGVVMHDNHEVT